MKVEGVAMRIERDKDRDKRLKRRQRQRQRMGEIDRQTGTQAEAVGSQGGWSVERSGFMKMRFERICKGGGKWRERESHTHTQTGSGMRLHNL